MKRTLTYKVNQLLRKIADEGNCKHKIKMKKKNEEDLDLIDDEDEEDIVVPAESRRKALKTLEKKRKKAPRKVREEMDDLTDVDDVPVEEPLPEITADYAPGDVYLLNDDLYYLVIDADPESFKTVAFTSGPDYQSIGSHVAEMDLSSVIVNDWDTPEQFSSLVVSFIDNFANYVPSSVEDEIEIVPTEKYSKKRAKKFRESLFNDFMLALDSDNPISDEEAEKVYSILDVEDDADSEVILTAFDNLTGDEREEIADIIGSTALENPERDDDEGEEEPEDELDEMDDENPEDEVTDDEEEVKKDERYRKFRSSLRKR